MLPFSKIKLHKNNKNIFIVEPRNVKAFIIKRPRKKALLSI